MLCNIVVIAVILYIVVIINNMLSMDSKAGSSVEYFSLITFSDVPESYSTLTDVVCCFTRALNMSPESADYVGIFPVGWQSVDEYVCSKPVIISADPESTHSVTFLGTSLSTSLIVRDIDFMNACQGLNACLM